MTAFQRGDRVHTGDSTPSSPVTRGAAMSEPTVLDRIADQIEVDWEVTSETVHQHQDAPYQAVYIDACPLEVARTAVECLGIPADFPAADLPKAIAMWRRILDASSAPRQPSGSNEAWWWSNGWNDCLLHLRGET